MSNHREGSHGCEVGEVVFGNYVIHNLGTLRLADSRILLLEARNIAQDADYLIDPFARPPPWTYFSRCFALGANASRRI